jgi:transcriptional regulator of heat shock response
MVRQLDQSDRKNKVLAATVSSYIKSGNPVSSQELAQHFVYSSATMRNILAELEDDGYLFQPHTSAGRVPTDKGYRYYVDFLMGQVQLTPDQKESILNEYKKRITSLEDVLQKTTQIIATLTHYTAIVSFSDWDDRFIFAGLSNIIQQPEFADKQKLFLIIKLLEEKRQLLKLLNAEISQPTIYIGGEISCSYINEECSLIVSPYKKGKKKDNKKGKVAVLGPRRMTYDQAVSTLAFVAETLDDLLEDY